jgi:hypothetical protein
LDTIVNRKRQKGGTNMAFPSHIRSKRFIEYINVLKSRKELKKRQKEETTEDAFKWELEGAIREIELIILELENLITKKD